MYGSPGRLAATGASIGTVGLAGYAAPLYALIAAGVIVVGLLALRLASKLGQR